VIGFVGMLAISLGRPVKAFNTVRKIPEGLKWWQKTLPDFIDTLMRHEDVPTYPSRRSFMMM
jgi:hypothetical protein